MMTMIGQTISHYRILEKLGAGGMGEVYLAEDTKLERRVALKFLPESLRHDPEARERLLREARAASQLIHPNILTVHAVEEAEGRDFIVMEYLPGDTLSKYIRERRPALPEMLPIVIQIAEGLDKAHRAGIVHRDLKPANVLIDEDGRPRILDFGLAKLRGSLRLTKEGSTLGTVAYSSPEQARGQDVDARADLFSFGVILYEMITGHLPFAGEHESAVVYAITNEPPTPIQRHRQDVPEAWERIVARCLEKEPGRRYQSAAEVLVDLRALAGSQPPRQTVAKSRAMSRNMVILGAVIVLIAVVGYMTFSRYTGFVNAPSDSGRKMLAVLPFENLGTPEQEYFADGITDEIISRLAGVAGLGVISRTSSIQYKRTDKSLPTVASELGVEYILEGTIRWDQSGDTDRVRITPQLIRVKDDTHLWSTRIERPLSQVFAVQAEIAEKVVSELGVALGATEAQSLSARPTASTQAYDLYMRATGLLAHLADEENRRAAARLFEAAVIHDSMFVWAWAQLSMVNTELYWHHGKNPGNRLRARQALARAEHLSPNSAEFLLARGVLEYHDYEYEKALASLARAAQLRPNDVFIMTETLNVLWRQGKAQAVLDLTRRAISLDPQSAQLIVNLADVLVALRRFEEASAAWERYSNLTPELADGPIGQARTLILRNGDLDEARKMLAPIRDLIGSVLIRGNFFQLEEFVLVGDFEEASERTIANDDFWQARAHNTRAMIHLAAGDSMAAHRQFDSAQSVAEKFAAADSTELEFTLQSALAHAGLGHHEVARERLQRFMELAQHAPDMSNRISDLYCLALIEVWLGDEGMAVTRLDSLLSIPSPYSGRFLALDPRLVELRDNPRFQELVARPDKVYQ